MVLRLNKLAPMPVTTLPARRIWNPEARNEMPEPAAKTARPLNKPGLRPKTSERGPQKRTDRLAHKEYPVNRYPMSEDDLPTWARMAGSSGLSIWLSATPIKRIKKRHAMTLISSFGRDDIRALLEMLDSQMFSGDIAQVNNRSGCHAHRDRNGLTDLLRGGTKFLRFLDMAV